VLLLLGKMSVFDALNTAFSTAGTGGFSVRNDGMSSFSPYIQVVISIFMLLFSLNFGSYFLILRRQYKEALTTEVRAFLLIVVTAVIVITVNISGMFDRAGDALRHALFTASSIISTTGFATVDFDLWPELSRGILVLLMFIGACAGSTGGGIKVSRLIILFKGMARELRAAVHPKEVRKVTVDGKPLEQSVISATFAYLACFVLVFLGSLLLVSLDNHDLPPTSPPWRQHLVTSAPV
jgi:trk system potassium uptake protein TrkH